MLSRVVVTTGKKRSAPVPPKDAPASMWQWRPGDILRVLKKALSLVHATSPRLLLLYGLFTLVLGALPPSIAYCSRRLVDAVVQGVGQWSADPHATLLTCGQWILFEAALVFGQDGASRVLRACQSLLRGLLGHRVNLQILEKACELDLSSFEDADFYDKLTKARRGASSRPLSLVDRSCTLIQQSLTLVGVAALLIEFSPYAVLLVLCSALPSFLAETKFAGQAFEFFSLKSEDTRRQYYYETALTQDRYAKELKIFGLGKFFLARYQQIFEQLFATERRHILRREFWLFFWGRVRFAGFYAGCVWVMIQTLQGRLTLGQMTMYWMLLRQGQQAVQALLRAVGAMYEDHLYLGTLDEYLSQPSAKPDGQAIAGPDPSRGIEFESVSFVYPGAAKPALCEVSFSLRPGESLALVGENGAGKTTLIKLLTRLYRPSEGRILLDGLCLSQWQHQALLQRMSVIFQDFNRYHLAAGTNIGVGDLDRIEDREAWAQSARLGMAHELIEGLPQGYDTQLGRWFRQGHELSGGQWQKIALSRAMMRSGAQLFVFDEPTAAMDAQAEMKVFEHLREICSAGDQRRMLLLISHRFSAVRMADTILVMRGGEIIERGDHAQLMGLKGSYARLYKVAAQGFRDER